MKKELLPNIVAADFVAKMVRRNPHVFAGVDVADVDEHPLTGFLAFDGGHLRKGLLLAVDEINRTGGIKALGGGRFEGLGGEPEGQPAGAGTEGERLHAAGKLTDLPGIGQSTGKVIAQALDGAVPERRGVLRRPVEVGDRGGT